MKKVIPFLLAAILISACGTANTEQPTDTTKKEKVAELTTTTTKEPKEKIKDEKPKTETNTLAATTEKEVIKMPTERTVNFGPDYPWKRAGYKRLKELIDKGETVFLWSDAEPLEQQIKRTFSYSPPEDAPTTKAENLKSMNHYIETFVYGMQKQGLNKPEYLDQISNVGELMAAGKLDEAKAALDKATQIRTGQ